MYSFVHTNLRQAWYILSVKYVVIIIIYNFAVLEYKVLGFCFLTSVARTPFPGLLHRLQHVVVKRQVEYRSAKRYNAIVGVQRGFPRASLLVLQLKADFGSFLCPRSSLQERCQCCVQKEFG